MNYKKIRMQKLQEQLLKEEKNLNDKIEEVNKPVNEDADFIATYQRKKRDEKAAYKEFEESTFNGLLKEAYMIAFNECFFPNKVMIENEDLIREKVVDDFIVQEGGAKVLTEKMLGKTMLLSEMADTVIRYHDALLESYKAGDKEIKNEIKESFYKEISALDDIETVGLSVRGRVQQALQQFACDNEDRKAQIEAANEIGKAKVATAKGEILKDSIRGKVHHKIKEIREAKETIFDSVMYNIVTEGYKENAVEDKEAFMENSMDCAEVLYTFLEFVNTSKIKEFGKEDVMKTINELKAI